MNVPKIESNKPSDVSAPGEHEAKSIQSGTLDALDPFPEASGDVVTEALVSLQKMLKQAQVGQRAVRNAENEARYRASLAEASDLREKAGAVRTGAVVSGSFLAASAASTVLELSASGKVTEQSDGSTPSGKMWGGMAGTLRSGSNVAGSFAEAAGTSHEADAAEERAKAERARAHAEDASDLAKEAGEAVQKALDAIQAIGESRNAAMMAILSPRG